MSYAFIAHWSSTHEGHGEVRPRMKLETCLIQVVGPHVTRFGTPWTTHT